MRLVRKKLHELLPTQLHLLKKYKVMQILFEKLKQNLIKYANLFPRLSTL